MIESGINTILLIGLNERLQIYFISEWNFVFFRKNSIVKGGEQNNRLKE